MTAPVRETSSIFRSSWKRKIVVLAMGTMASLVLLEIGLRVVGVVHQYASDFENDRAVRERGSYRILCIGESTTFMGGEFS